MADSAPFESMPSGARPKNAKARRAEKFRTQKNIPQQKAIENRIATNLRAPSLPAPRAHEILQPFPIVLYGLPSLIDAVWDYLGARGPRPFQNWYNPPQGADRQDYANGVPVFKKVMIYAATAKIQYAQRSPPSHHECLALVDLFTESQLQVLALAVSRLPKPLAMYLDAIGNITVDGIQCTPRLSSGDFRINMSSVGMATFIQGFTNVVDTNESLETITRMANLFSFNLAVGHENVNAHSISLAAQQFVGFPSVAQLGTFANIINTLQSVPNILISCDITHGNGSLAQCVRFTDQVCTGHEQSYYLMVQIPPTEEVLAAAWFLGQDVGDTNSFLCKSSAYCRRRGEVSRPAIIQLLMSG